jgi:succinate dehydrogenase hydrophobic anchor subunit
MLNKFSPLNWKLQRYTGAALFVLVIYHFLDQHILIEKTLHKLNPALAGAKITDPVLLNCKWAVSVEHMTSPGFKITYALFLLAALYHALGGVRLAILDQGFDEKKQKALFWLFAAIGLAFGLLGVHTLIATHVPEGFSVQSACAAVAAAPAP